ncbi:hypothetical protein D3C80_1168940 [compost metagenome]
MNSGSSAPISFGAQVLPATFIRSSYQTSRCGFHLISPPVRLTTMIFCTLLVSGLVSASSTLAFSGVFLPPRRPSSAVITTLERQSMMRPARASGEKPPNTTEWMAPMRVQASMATTASGIIGM